MKQMLSDLAAEAVNPTAWYAAMGLAVAVLACVVPAP